MFEYIVDFILIILKNAPFYIYYVLDILTLIFVRYGPDWPIEKTEKNITHPPSILSLSEKYISNTKTKFLLTYDLTTETSIDYNSNIDTLFYSKEEYQKLMESENNPLETQWKTRIMIENTPRGNIIIFYNVYKQGFSYYCDQTNIPYSLLNAVAMKYVLKYRCRDFFIDEFIVPSDAKSKLILQEKVENKETNKTNEEDDMDIWMKTHADVKKGPFAKLKSYNQATTKVVSKNKENENLKLTNRFISLGHIRNFTILQKPPKEVQSKIMPTNKKMSYQEYKRLLSEGETQ